MKTMVFKLAYRYTDYVLSLNNAMLCNAMSMFNAYPHLTSKEYHMQLCLSLTEWGDMPIRGLLFH